MDQLIGTSEADDNRLFGPALAAAAMFHALILVLGTVPQSAPRILEPAVVRVFQEAPMPRVKPRPPEPSPSRLPELQPLREVAVPFTIEVEPLVRALEPSPIAPSPDVAWLAPLPTLEPPPVPADFDGPIDVGGRVIAPVKLFAPLPQMPALALRVRREGDVVLQATIDRAGELVGLEVVSGPGMGLEEAALSAVRTWRFAPATLDDRPVAVRWRLVVAFRLAR